MTKAAILLAAVFSRGCVLAFALACVAGCGSSVVQLSHDELDRLPRDSRQEIFDAENDLVIARNRQDEAQDRKIATESALEQLGERWKRTEKRLTASGGGARIPQARKVFDTKKVYLSSLLEVTDAGIETTRLDAELSRARLVLVRQRQAARIGRATLGSLKPLQEKVVDAEARMKAAAGVQNNLRIHAQSLLDSWKNAEDEYARASGDYDTGVWE